MVHAILLEIELPISEDTQKLIEAFWRCVLFYCNPVISAHTLLKVWFVGPIRSEREKLTQNKDAPH